MSQKLFIGSLAWGTTDETLNAHFAAIGEVEEATVVKDRDSGRSKGFGFITYKNEDDGKKAIEQLDGSELDGRNITVSEARPREDRPRRDFNGGGNRNNGGSSFRQRSW
ncbi:MAG TPA: RNA-binding protein [Candidatus Saccharimonadales bacterium]